MRRYRKLHIFFAMIVFMLAIVPMQQKVSAVTKSKCTSISRLTDPLAIQMEKGKMVIWDKVDPKLGAAKAKYEKLLKVKGWKIKYKSAYRPYQYQKHFYEIIHAPASSCKYAEIRKHSLVGVVSYPRPDAPHVAGIAFDAVVYDKKGRALNSSRYVSSSLKAVAKKAGLTFRLPTSDGVHHEVISSTPAPKKETKLKKKGKITTAVGFNVRTAPQATAKRLGSVAKNKTVQIVSKRGDWYKIKFGRGYGYIMAVKTGLRVL
ncbi:SH3 domain-containing protein [Bacillus rubiinfantis]|uniref:SH3 domain-containing protein n=1 Tax=Bacillus rubiinfantis TaxID=1499680 RepID=UPI000694FFC3|nr:SH3 domain-containing protein [Bacillus rubiinfantis]